VNDEAGIVRRIESGSCATRCSTSILARSVSSGSGALDESRDDPSEQDSGENQKGHRDDERDAECEAGEGGHGRKPVAGRRPPGARRAMRDDEETARYSSRKAVVSTLLILGILVVAVLLFTVVLVQRAC
jgi:cobalamin biosynthesis Mg chelatase CobN